MAAALRTFCCIIMKIPTLGRLASLFRASIAFVLCALFVTGCTSLQQIPSNDLSHLTSTVKPGDQLVCDLRDGSVLELTVASVESDAIVTESGRRLAIADLTRVQIKRSDKTKSVLLGLAVAGVVAIAIAAAGGGGHGGGGY
jgi:hypothetical protein